MCAQLSVRLLVVGDSGVGKSSLVHLLCHNEVLKSPQTTIGCRVSVKVRQRSQSGKLQFIEFFEVGGNTKYRRQARHPFYHTFNGIIFVYDMADESTLASLWDWNKEIQDCLELTGQANSGTTTTLPSPSTQPTSRMIDNPYACISQRKGASFTKPETKGFKHRPTTQSFDTNTSDTPGCNGSPSTSSPSMWTDSSLGGSHFGDDESGSAMGLPPVLIVGTKSDLAATKHFDSNPAKCWQRDLKYLGGVILRKAAQVMRRVLFLPMPVKNFLQIGIQSDALGDKSGLDPNGRKAAEVLDFLRKQWNATTLDISCHSLQEEKVHKVELFMDKVMDGLFSYSCKV
mmetsp:Transcript_132005/g.228787  ORF Transcript_132005/g.228787 Transcript_132005/m.228787 type:complete len:343 (-) Transcript_132005:1940-2968(-)